jgi:hypothetical protein
MIKTKLAFIFWFLTLGGLSVQCQTSNNIKKIEYTTLTRGYQKHVVISADSVKVSVEGRNEDRQNKRALSKTEWNSVMGALKDVAISSIPSLPSPTMKRAYDGALHSTLTLTTRDQTEFGHSFDDENPDPKLMPLMRAVIKIADTENAQDK